jgi:hypothetical protein
MPTSDKSYGKLPIRSKVNLNKIILQILTPKRKNNKFFPTRIGIVYEAVLFANIMNYSKPAKRFQLCDDQIGVNAVNCSMRNGNKRSIEFPGNYDQNMLKMAFSNETVNGALLMDYLGSWVLSLDFMPESKECVNVEYGECQFEVKIFIVYYNFCADILE